MCIYQAVGPLVATPLGYRLFRKELLEPLSQALVFAQRAEAVTGDPSIETLEELDEIASEHLTRWSGSYQGHWSQFLDTREVLNSYSSFMDLAVAYDLYGYVVVRIDHEHRQYIHRVERGLEGCNLRWAQEYFRRYKQITDTDDDGTTQQRTLPQLAGKGVRYHNQKQDVLEPVLDFHIVTPLDVAVRPSFRDLRWQKFCSNMALLPTTFLAGRGSGNMFSVELRRHQSKAQKAGNGCKPSTSF